MSKPRENPLQHHEKTSARTGEENQTPEQETSQTPAASDRPPGELGLYSALANELNDKVRHLSLLHDQRASFQGKSDALKAEHAALEQKVLDGDHEAIAELVLNHDAVTLNEVKLSALSVRTERLETELHTRLPLALVTFERLRSYVCSSVLDSCRTKVRTLIDPSTNVDQMHIDVVAICMPAYVAISRVTLPSLTHTITRDLEFSQPHWSSLVRPFTEAEKRAQRAETVDSLIAAANEMLLAAGRLLEAAGPYAQGDIPPFREAEVPAPPQSVAPLEWLQPLGGSDEEWLREVCTQAGKPYPPTDPAQIEILNKMLEQRHAMPQSHGIVTAEMIGSTFVP